MSLSVFILSVYHPCITMSNLNYLFSREVFIYVMLWAIWFFHWTTCQIWSTYRPLKLWDWGTRFTIVARLVFNRLEIVESSASRSLLESVLNRPHDHGQVGHQLLLDRGDAFLIDSNRVGSGLSSLVSTRSKFTVLDLYVASVNYQLWVRFSDICQRWFWWAVILAH
jgi:hypothetical protein